MIGYLADSANSLESSGFDSRYISKYESRPGATDIQNVQQIVKMAFNGIAKEYNEATGNTLLITGAAEKNYHATGPYGHEGGWKIDIDPPSSSSKFLELCQKYGAAVGDEGDHYDLAFHSGGSTGGTLLATPARYLSDMTDGEVNAQSSSGTMPTEVPLLKQYDDRWASHPYNGKTVASSGCGPTSLAMIARWYGIDIFPNDVADYAMEIGGCGPGGTYTDFYPKGAEHFGFEMKSCSKEEAVEALKKGYPVLAPHPEGMFTTGEHIIVYAKLIGEDSLIVNDPGSPSIKNSHPDDYQFNLEDVLADNAKAGFLAYIPTTPHEGVKPLTNAQSAAKTGSSAAIMSKLSQFAGFRFEPHGSWTRVIKLPEKKTFCEPIYPDLITIEDSVPEWALRAAVAVNNEKVANGTAAASDSASNSDSGSSASGQSSSQPGSGGQQSSSGSSYDTSTEEGSMKAYVDWLATDPEYNASHQKYQQEVDKANAIDENKEPERFKEQYARVQEAAAQTLQVTKNYFKRQRELNPNYKLPSGFSEEEIFG